MVDHLTRHPQVEYVAGRNFTYDGVEYKVGDEFPNTGSVKTEVLVRSRHLIPVTDNVDDLPRYPFRGLVKTRELVFAKLGKEDPRTAEQAEVEPEAEEHPKPKRGRKAKTEVVEETEVEAPEAETPEVEAEEVVEEDIDV